MEKNILKETNAFIVYKHINKILRFVLKNVSLFIAKLKLKKAKNKDGVYEKKKI